MKERIKQNMHWINAFLILVVLLVLTYFISPISTDISPSRIFALLMVPFSEITFYATRTSIDIFSGDQILFSDYYINTVLLICGTTIILMLSTLFLVKGVKKAEELPKESTKRSIYWYLGVIVISFSFIISVSILIMGSISFSNSKDASSFARLNDQARLELMDLAFEASSKMLTDQSVGGGGGSFEGFTAQDGSTRLIRLQDLDSYNESSDFTFEIKKGSNDKTIEIYANLDLEKMGIDRDEEETRDKFRVVVSPFEKNIYAIR